MLRLLLGLEWWQSNAEYFPLLAAVARKRLAVSASSAASQRLFSAAGLVVTKKHTRLKSERVESLVFLKAC
jgi:zinc finger BED domain-containing protein 1 (E3 SUMO-protein ligase ZBED1)